MNVLSQTRCHVTEEGASILLVPTDANALLVLKSWVLVSTVKVFSLETISQTRISRIIPSVQFLSGFSASYPYQDILLWYSGSQLVGWHDISKLLLCVTSSTIPSSLSQGHRPFLSSLSIPCKNRIRALEEWTAGSPVLAPVNSKRSLIEFCWNHLEVGIRVCIVIIHPLGLLLLKHFDLFHVKWMQWDSCELFLTLRIMPHSMSNV